MYPRLFTFGPVTVYTYGVLMALAFVAGLRLAIARARGHGIDAARVLDLGVFVIVAAVVGAKLMLLAVDFRSVASDPMQLFSVARSGGVFYGGLIAAVAVGFWYMRRHQLPTWPTFDAFAPGIALGHAIGRLGCLGAGCCFGRQTTVPWAITFHDAFASGFVGTPLGVPLHPTQLYEAGAEALILAILLVGERRGRSFPGRTIWAYLALYAVSRFVIEFFRGDERGAVGPISTSQFVSLVLLPASLVMLVRLARGSRSRAAEPTHGPAPVRR
jgi:phosphatidylglycerol:prolipoprotein diacylglycerol transferase